jgi:hypothetical protein
VVRNDVSQPRHIPEGRVGGDQRIGAAGTRYRGEDGIERTETRMCFEEVEPVARMCFFDEKERGEHVCVLPSQGDRVRAVAPAPSDVRELLDDLGSGRGFQVAVPDSVDETSAWFPKEVVSPFGIR